jgi:hypothetical protein
MTEQSMEPEFISWPKIPRYKNERIIITEKIDGTIGAIIVTEWGDVFAQSRHRIIKPDCSDDNFGFGSWVAAHKSELFHLGVGHHFGEWWGQGIQRRYGMQTKQFSVFNTYRPAESLPDIVRQVPILPDDIDEALAILHTQGSQAAPGYMRPEGIVIYSCLYKLRYKIIIEEDL